MTTSTAQRRAPLSSALIPSEIVSSAEPSELAPSQVARELKTRLARGARLVCAGRARQDPEALLSAGYSPKNKVELFGFTYYLTRPRQNPDLRFFIAYLVPPGPPPGRPIYVRIFYKDISLIWRVASHLFMQDDELWIGKGDTKTESDGEWQTEVSAESTTDLPFEIQSALETFNRVRAVRYDLEALDLVLRNAPRNRIGAYDDFVKPRRQAASVARNRIHRGRPVVYFRRKNDPTSQVVVPGYEPDYAKGVLEVSRHGSKLYGGEIRRYRVLSKNRKIQHLFFDAPDHVWMIPPQALTTELSSFGVRTIDVEVDEDAYIPGYEYHFEEDGELHTQIPHGYVGELHPFDDTRADASAWLHRIPMLRQFRRFARRQR